MVIANVSKPTNNTETANCILLPESTRVRLSGRPYRTYTLVGEWRGGTFLDRHHDALFTGSAVGSPLPSYLRHPQCIQTRRRHGRLHHLSRLGSASSVGSARLKSSKATRMSSCRLSKRVRTCRETSEEDTARSATRATTRRARCTKRPSPIECLVKGLAFKTIRRLQTSGE